MTEFQYLTQTLFGQAYTEVQKLTDVQQSKVMVLHDLAKSYMSTQGLEFQAAVDLAHKDIIESTVDVYYILELYYIYSGNKNMATQ